MNDRTLSELKNSIGYSMAAHGGVSPITVSEEWTERARVTSERVYEEQLQPLEDMLAEAGFAEETIGLSLLALIQDYQRLSTLVDEEVARTTGNPVALSDGA